MRINNNNRKHTHITFYEVIAVHVLMYVSEKWVVNRTKWRKTETAKMRFLRNVS
jgi:hypothetical protein